jgi:hypothetical protein
MKNAVALAGIATALLTTGSALAIQPDRDGSYRQSCENIYWEGNVLHANCRRMNGTWVHTTMPDANRCLGGLDNIDGYLRCDTTPKGSFWDSCVNVGWSGRTLWADCRSRSGNWRHTSIDLFFCRTEVWNNDGYLTCN